jgi:nucleoside diphosphate kinase
MIKPDAVDRAGLIFTRIVKEGFLVVEQQRFRFSPELAELFYAEHKDKPFFGKLIDYITSGPVVGMCLARKDGIRHWGRVLGPTKVSDAKAKAPSSIRAMFGDPKNDSHNVCHGSDSPGSAEREIEIIFPHILRGSEDLGASSSRSHGGLHEEAVGGARPGTGESAMINGHTFPIGDTKAVFKGAPDLAEVNEPNQERAAHKEFRRNVTTIESMDNKEYLQRYVSPTLLKGLSEMYETRPQSPIEWLADWLEENNPYRT